MNVHPKKKALVLSDNEGLSRVIELALKGRIEIVRLKPNADQPQQWNAARDVQLIVLALSSHTSESVVALARAALVDCIGHVPLLIISEHSFVSDAETHIAHLDFPFTIDKLYDQVDKILQAPLDGPRDPRPPGLCAR